MAPFCRLALWLVLLAVGSRCEQPEAALEELMLRHHIPIPVFSQFSRLACDGPSSEKSAVLQLAAVNEMDNATEAAPPKPEKNKECGGRFEVCYIDFKQTRVRVVSKGEIVKAEYLVKRIRADESFKWPQDKWPPEEEEYGIDNSRVSGKYIGPALNPKFNFDRSLLKQQLQQMAKKKGQHKRESSRHTTMLLTLNPNATRNISDDQFQTQHYPQPVQQEADLAEFRTRFSAPNSTLNHSTNGTVAARNKSIPEDESEAGPSSFEDGNDGVLQPQVDILSRHPEVFYDGEPENNLGRVPIGVSWHPSMPATAQRDRLPSEAPGVLSNKPADFDSTEKNPGRFTLCLINEPQRKLRMNSDWATEGAVAADVLYYRIDKIEKAIGAGYKCDNPPKAYTDIKGPKEGGIKEVAHQVPNGGPSDIGRPTDEKDMSSGMTFDIPPVAQQNVKDSEFLQDSTQL